MPVPAALSPSPEDRWSDKHTDMDREDLTACRHPFLPDDKGRTKHSCQCSRPGQREVSGPGLLVFFVILSCIPIMQTVNTKLAFRPIGYARTPSRLCTCPGDPQVTLITRLELGIPFLNAFPEKPNSFRISPWEHTGHLGFLPG